MSDNLALVRAFVDAWNRMDLEAVLGYLAPDVVYHNMPMEPLHGVESVREALAPFLAPATNVDWEVLHIAESGDSVLTERVDRFWYGPLKIEIPVMGTFDIRRGKIARWRDYFDLAHFQRQMPAPPEGQHDPADLSD
jgi:limonene-1,2-epoxide hydrolase